ncbi:MAG: HU family DNA-binding protein [Chitinophagales bacterium]|nr:HU family DNA-binding protein [Bacteroidota bacterium]
MNKSQLTDHIAQAAGITKAQAGEAINAFTDAITTSLKKGDKVALVGFGTFSVSTRSARTSRNPQTGKPIQIPAKNVAKFKAGKGLDDVIN